MNAPASNIITTVPGDFSAIGDIVRNHHGDVGVIQPHGATRAIAWISTPTAPPDAETQDLTTINITELTLHQLVRAFDLAGHAHLMERNQLSAQHADTLENISQRVLEKYKEGNEICDQGMRQFFEDFDLPFPVERYRTTIELDVEIRTDFVTCDASRIEEALGFTSADPAIHATVTATNVHDDEWRRHA